MMNRTQRFVGAMLLATMFFCGSVAFAATNTISLALAPASGTTNILPITLSGKVSIFTISQTKNTNLGGGISSNLTFNIDPSTHQIDSNGITGISFNKSPAGQITMSDMHYNWNFIFSYQNVDMTGLAASAYTLTPPGSVTKVDAANYTFPVLNHALEINKGNIVWEGAENG
jgi:hypothetical protein